MKDEKICNAIAWFIDITGTITLLEKIINLSIAYKPLNLICHWDFQGTVCPCSFLK